MTSQNVRFASKIFVLLNVEIALKLFYRSVSMGTRTKTSLLTIASKCTNITKVNNAPYSVKARISINCYHKHSFDFRIKNSIFTAKQQKSGEAFVVLSKIHSRWKVQLYLQQTQWVKNQRWVNAKSIKCLNVYRRP